MMYRSPYDRENTSMRKYKLCSECLSEYNDINNIRRYHAQGISCPKDGPKLWLADKDGEKIEEQDPLGVAAKLLDEGNIIAVKGIGGYHIASLATDDDVVLRLRKLKGRPTKPFAIMGLDVRVLSKIVVLNNKAIEILNSPIRPIILLPKLEGSPVSKHVSPGMDVEGVLTPYTPLHYLLLSGTKDKFLIMTSGNAYGEPMCVDEECAFRCLKHLVDYFLVHDREIVNRVDDSVVRFTDDEPVILRRGRGYAPRWIRIPFKLRREIVALGGDLQTAGAVGFENKVVLTQFIGDLESSRALTDLDKYLKFFIENYKIDLGNSIVAVDKHPGYLSRRLGFEYADKYGMDLIEVQHHYAHALSAATDVGILGKHFISIVIDGLGYGDDGAIWGGEVIEVFANLNYRRIGHLEYLPLVGDASIIRPVRFLATMLLSILDFHEVEKLLKKLKVMKGLKGEAKELKILEVALKTGKYVKTSSAGRFLDAVSSALGIRLLRTYEGEPAIALEAYSRGGRILDELVWAFSMSNRGSEGILNTLDALMLGLQLLTEDEKLRRDIALTFQYGLGYWLGALAIRFLKGHRDIASKIVISGGAAVNDYIVKGIRAALRDHDLEALLPYRIPPNDGGIALGQAVASLRSK